MKLIILLSLLLSFFHVATAGEITVSTSAEKSITPDYLEWSLHIKSIKPSLDESQAEVASQLNALIKLLDQLNIKGEDRSINMFKHGKHTYYDNKVRKQVHDGFYSSRHITFKLRDTKAYTTVLKQLLQFEAITIQNVAFKSSQVQELQEQLLIQALKKSKTKATRMAAALGMQVGIPLSIQEGFVRSPVLYNSSDHFSARSLSKDEDNSTALKQINISATVTVVYEITPK